jgi:hypothetical protein
MNSLRFRHVLAAAIVAVAGCSEQDNSDRVSKLQESVERLSADDGFTEWMASVPFHEFLSEKEMKDENGQNFWDRGHWILAAEGRWHDGQQEYRIRFGDAPKNKGYLWTWYLNMNQQEFDRHIEALTRDGYTMVQHNSFTRPSGTIMYQAVWHNDNPKKEVEMVEKEGN